MVIVCLPQDVERLGTYIARSCLEGKISPKTKLHINKSSCEGLHQEWVLVLIIEHVVGPGVVADNIITLFAVLSLVAGADLL